MMIKGRVALGRAGKMVLCGEAEAKPGMEVQHWNGAPLSANDERESLPPPFPPGARPLIPGQPPIGLSRPKHRAVPRVVSWFGSREQKEVLSLVHQRQSSDITASLNNATANAAAIYCVCHRCGSIFASDQRQGRLRRGSPESAKQRGALITALMFAVCCQLPPTPIHRRVLHRS